MDTATVVLPEGMELAEFRPLVWEHDDIGLTEILLEDDLIIWKPWTPTLRVPVRVFGWTLFKLKWKVEGRFVDLGYSEDGRLIGIAIWSRVLWTDQTVKQSQ